MILTALTLLIGDIILGPYVNPEVLPPSATKSAWIYGDTLYQETSSGLPYVIHLSSGAKIYNPIIYDAASPFELRYAAGGLEVRNASFASAEVIAPSPQVPTLAVGGLDYVYYHIAGSHWGFYYANNQVDTSLQGYETVGVWPPSSSIQNYFENNYSIEDYRDLKFTSVTRSSGDHGVVLKFYSSTNDQLAIKVRYSPLTVGSNFHSWRGADLLWAGALDTNVDGSIQSADYNQFVAWYSSNDLRADFTRDGTIAEDDLYQFSLAIAPILEGIEVPPVPAAGDNAAVKAGCGLMNAGGSSTSNSLFVFFLALVILGIYRAQETSRNTFVS